MKCAASSACGRSAGEAREKVGELAEVLGADPKSVQGRYDAAIQVALL